MTFATNFKHQMRTRKQDKARKDRADAKARKACTDAVWKRAGMFWTGSNWLGHCEECGAMVYRAHTIARLVGHVDELVPRSQGGDPHDPDNCRLLCPACHFSGPSGAHRLTPNWRQDARQ